MKFQSIKFNTLLNVNESVEGETIETKIERITTQNEPITDGAPIIYTERKDGVMAEYDPRTDRFEIAIDAMSTIQKAKMAERAQRIEPLENKKDGGEASSTDVTKGENVA